MRLVTGNRCQYCGQIIGGTGHYSAPQGCVCPPTAEQTCQSPTCPRKNPLANRTAA